jgi:hypothetical protein
MRISGASDGQTRHLKTIAPNTLLQIQLSHARSKRFLVLQCAEKAHRRWDPGGILAQHRTLVWTEG